jgi:hypothetical protein
MKSRSIIFSAFLVLLSLGLLAQESTVKGNLAGTVFDSSGAVVPKATVTMTGPIGKKTVTTDSDGRFVFDLLTPGFYSIRAEASGFKATEIRQVEVLVNRTASIRVTLQAGGASEIVEVSAAAAGVDEASTKLETSLNDTFYSQMPVSRNVTGLFYAAAGVSNGGGTGQANPSIGGSSGLENQYIADGVNITDGSFGGIGVWSRNYGPLSTGINLSFVKEVDVKTGGLESQYGKADGGVVQIVTKSGGNAFHGGFSAFFGPQQFEVQHLNPDATGRLNQQGVAFHQGEWDIEGELGGYVPGLKNHLFFFGSFNPAWNRLYDQLADFHGVGLFPTLGKQTIRQVSYDYAAKLTFKLSDNHSLESSVFGDPTRETSPAPNISLAAFSNTEFSKISDGTRNWVLRYNGTLSPTWLVNASLSWGHNYLTETPSAPNVFNIFDNTGAGCWVPTVSQLDSGVTCPTQAGNLGWLGTQVTGIYNHQGLGYYENTSGDNWKLAFGTQKVMHLLGEHTLSAGYNYERDGYGGSRQATGGGIPVPPGLAAASGLPSGLTDFADQFELDAASAWDIPSGVVTNVPGNGPTEVLLLQTRGFFSTPAFQTYERYHAVYGNDSWAFGRHLIINGGLRWDQERLIGSKYLNPLNNFTPTQIHYTFTDNWSPNIGIAIDPKGDRKTKIYANYGRYGYALPLDAAIRSLSNEEDAFFAFFQPPFTNPNPGTPCDAVSNPCQLALNSDGTITPTIDDNHSLTPYFAASLQGGEAIAHGTKQMYLEEYVAGIERELPHGIVASVRYQQRRLRRIVEDQSGVSPEANLLGITQQFFIGNPSSTSDIFTNTNETVYPVGGLPPSCDPNITPGAVGGTIFNPYNTAQSLADVCVTNPTVAGNTVPDGKPDGFVNPVRTYKAIEVELTKSFSHGWQWRSNYRWSTLVGNYEGAFRNDNGQADPGISSLFDFTPGSLNLLGNQFGLGFLNTDRRHIFNNFVSYTFATGMLRNLTLGTGVRIESGVPINDLRAHPVYQNGGEIPVGGRGSLGRTPTTGEGDVHAEYAFKVREKQSLHVGADLFNVANQKTQVRIDQFQDASLGTPNFDFKHPVGSGNIGIPPAYQRPFNARLFAKWEF